MGLVADVAPPERQAQCIGLVNGGASVGWMVGPLFGGLLYDLWSYQVPFALATAVALLALLFVAVFVPETRAVSKRPQGDAEAQSSVGVLASGLSRVWAPLSILLAVSFGSLFAWAFVQPPFMFYGYDELRWTSSQLGLLISLYGVTVMLGEFSLSHLSDLVGRKPVLAFGLVLFSAQFLGLAFTEDYVWIACSFVMAGAGNAIYDPALSALFMDLAPESYKSRFMGLKTTVASQGSMAGPALVVLATPNLASRGICALAFFLVLGIALLAILSLRGSARKHDSERWQVEPVP